MRILVPALLWLAGLGFLGFGVAFVIAPLETLAAAGIELSGDLAAIEIPLINPPPPSGSASAPILPSRKSHACR